MSAVAHWQAYWEGKSLAGFRYESEEHYQWCAEELRVLFYQSNPQSVLEIGCGNGALYEYLGFDQMDYRGVDFSPSMLKVFREQHPRLDLICADGSSYLDNRKYDLIFSNGVLQHFDRDMLQLHFDNARRMMSKESLFVCASIPWKALLSRYLSGELSGAGRPHYLRGMIFRMLHAFAQDGMGYWYEHRDFRQLAEHAGMSATFYGCIHYPYRFHAVMRLK